MSRGDDYCQWPFLNEEEFELACAFFDQRYIRAELGPTRRIFKIRARRTATTNTSYIEILRVLKLPDGDDDLLSAFQNMGNGEIGGNADVRMEDDIDEEALQPRNSDILPQYSTYSQQPYVTYEIHLHPTYRLPTLWFTLHDLPMGESTFDLDSVYRYLVPEEYKTQLRTVGIKGGISAAPHPVTDVPAFFIHPCQTKEAMESMQCSIDQYLMTWVGLVGGCVGLWIPSEMAQGESQGQ